MKQLLCIECGSPLPQDSESMVCHSCLATQARDLEEFLVLPESVTVTICPHCGARWKGKHWEDPQELEENLLSEVTAVAVPVKGVQVQKIEVSFVQTESKKYLCLLAGSFLYKGEEVEREHQIHAYVRKEVCEICSRRSGNYFEAIFQIRRDRKLSSGQLDQLADMVIAFTEKEEEKDRRSFITKMEEIHGGLDFYLGSTSLAQKLSTHLLNSFGGDLKTSASLVGRREGRNLYRVTQCVRLPKLEPGDVVQWISPYHNKEKIYLINSVSRKGAKVMDLHTHHEEFLDKRHFEELHYSEREQVKFDAVILFVEKEEFKIMDPENYESVVLFKPHPNYPLTPGGSVAVLKTDFGIFLAVKQSIAKEGEAKGFEEEANQG